MGKQAASLNGPVLTRFVPLRKTGKGRGDVAGKTGKGCAGEDLAPTAHRPVEGTVFSPDCRLFAGMTGGQTKKPENKHRVGRGDRSRVATLQRLHTH